MIVKDGLVHIPVGGGIVADSDPVAEYEETLVKARAMFAALEKEWGGTAQERLTTDYARYAAAAGVDVPPAPSDPATIIRLVDAEARAGAQPRAAATQAITPPSETAGAQAL